MRLLNGLAAFLAADLNAGPRRASMRKMVFAVVVILELYVALQLTLMAPYNLARVPYRQEERAAAWKALAEHRSPETEAAVREESRLASRYHTRRGLIRCGVLFAAFLALDVVCLYSWRCSRNSKTVVRPSAPHEPPPSPNH